MSASFRCLSCLLSQLWDDSSAGYPGDWCLQGPSRRLMMNISGRCVLHKYAVFSDVVWKIILLRKAMTEQQMVTPHPVEVTLSIIGGKWKPLIVFYLLSGTKRFGEIRRFLPQATQQMVTMQLRELEQAGILHRQVYAQVPPKVEYTLTDLGRSLEPVLRQMCTWGAWYSEQMGMEYQRLIAQTEHSSSGGQHD